MRVLVLSAAVMMSAVAAAQTQPQVQPQAQEKIQAQEKPQELRRAPPPGQGTGPISQPAPAPAPDYGYEDFDVPAGFRRAGPLVVIEREAVLVRMARMEQMLSQAMERSDRNTRNALRKLAEEMDGLEYDVSHAPDLRTFRRRNTPPPPPPSAPAVRPISEDRLQGLMKAIAKESFGEGKLRVLQAAAPTEYFLVPQVLKLLQRFSFGEDKLDAVRVLWPRVLDRENSYQLYGAFSFPGEKDELKQIIGR